MTTSIEPRVFIETTSHARIAFWVCVRRGADTFKAPRWKENEDGSTSLGDWKRYRDCKGVATCLGAAELRVDDQLAHEIQQAIEGSR